jgi:hypothetical protein
MISFTLTLTYYHFRLDLIVMFFHYLWVGPIETLVVTALMYIEIGIAAIAGVLFLLLFIPFQCKLNIFYAMWKCNYFKAHFSL